MSKLKLKKGSSNSSSKAWDLALSPFFAHRRTSDRTCSCIGTALLYCTVLYCTVCTVLYRTVLYYTVQLYCTHRCTSGRTCSYRGTVSPPCGGSRRPPGWPAAPPQCPPAQWSDPGSSWGWGHTTCDRWRRLERPLEYPEVYYSPCFCLQCLS